MSRYRLGKPALQILWETAATARREAVQDFPYGACREGYGSVNDARIDATGPPMLIQVIGCAMCESPVADDAHVYHLAMGERLRFKYRLCELCDCLQATCVKKHSSTFKNTLLKRLLLIWDHLADDGIAGASRLH